MSLFLPTRTLLIGFYEVFVEWINFPKVSDNRGNKNNDIWMDVFKTKEILNINIAKTFHFMNRFRKPWWKQASTKWLLSHARVDSLFQVFILDFQMVYYYFL